MNLSEVEAFCREKERASVSLISPDLKRFYATGVATNSYPVGYVIPKFQKFDIRRRGIREHVVRFLNSVGAHANEVDLCVRKF